MSKLPNAPLLEVIFELSWSVDKPSEREKFQFLLGDIYSKLKHEYPKRISLFQPPMAGFEVPIEILANKPIYRFIKNDFYPIYQIGPGILSVNTVDSEYFWETFEKEILKILKEFQSSYDFDLNTSLNVALKYIDFYEFNFESDAYSFLKKYLHLDINSNIRPLSNANPIFITFGAGYRNKLGLFNVIINKGSITQKGEGFVVETNITSKISVSQLNEISLWLQEAHSFLSENFKRMTEGEMYNSFNKFGNDNV